MGQHYEQQVFVHLPVCLLLWHEHLLPPGSAQNAMLHLQLQRAKKLRPAHHSTVRVHMGSRVATNSVSITDSRCTCEEVNSYILQEDNTRQPESFDAQH